MKAVSFARMKSINRGLVLDLLRTHGPTSRTAIAQATGLAVSAVAKVVAELIEVGLVCERGTAPSRGGRPPTLVAFNEGGGAVVGLKVGYTDTVGVLTDLGGRVLAQASEPTGPDRSWPSVRAKIIRLVGSLVEAQADRVKGVGVGVAGWVDTAAGVSVFSPNFGWRHVPVRSELQEALGHPVWVDNDARVVTLGEWRHGSGRGQSHFACVMAGSAIGAGYIVDGRLYSGAHGTAGEIGHTVVDPDGPRCSCGKYGCLEALASGRAIADAAAAALKRGRSSSLWDAIDGDVRMLTGALVGEHASQGDPLSIEVMERSGRYLGAALAIMVNLVNPRRIGVGGGVGTAGEMILGPLRDTFRRQAVGYSGEQTEIVLTQLGHLAGPIGAAELVINHLVSPTQLGELLEGQA